MANDFMTMTPGSEVGDALQEILVRRRQAKQQDFLNSLQTKTQADNEAYRNMQAQSLADERQAHEAQMQSEDWNRRAQLHGGEAAAGLSPEDLQYGLQHGWLSQDHVAALTGDQAGGAQPSGAPTASEPTYHWGDTDKSRAAGVKASQSKALQALMDSPAFQKLPPLNQLAIRAKITGGEVPGGADFTEAPKPTNAPRYKMNKLTGKLEPMLGPDNMPLMGPENAPVEMWGEQPQQPPSDPNDALQFFSFDDPSGAQNPDGTPKQAQVQTTPRIFNNPHTIGHLLDNTIPGVRPVGSIVHKGNEAATKAQPQFNQTQYLAYLRMANDPKGQDPTVLSAARSGLIGSIPNKTLQDDVRQLDNYIDKQGGPDKVTEAGLRNMIQPPPNTDPQQYQNAVINMLKTLKRL